MGQSLSFDTQTCIYYFCESVQQFCDDVLVSPLYFVNGGQ
jgi:Zn-finger protein